MEKEGINGFTPYSDDDDKNTVKPQYFKTERGTGQGDVSSPLTWMAVMDILLLALNESRPEESLYFMRRGGVMVEARDTCFAEDLTSYAANLHGLQRKADIVSAFTIIAGLDVALTKFRVFHLV